MVCLTAADKAKYAAQARVHKALAHPTRLFIVEELSRQERCVCELTAMVGVEMPTMSRHLSVLKAAGIVEDDKRGRVMSLFSMSILGMAPFGSLLAGIMATHIGAPMTLVIFGTLCITVTLFFIAWMPVVRRAIECSHFKEQIPICEEPIEPIVEP